MSMFCYQCQEAAKGIGCNVKGVCGKEESTAKLLDTLLYVVKGISVCNQKNTKRDKKVDGFVIDALFTTITNVNFDDNAIAKKIRLGLDIRDSIKNACSDSECTCKTLDVAKWTGSSIEDFITKAETIGVLSTENEDVRSLRELIVYGVKGMAAYLHHAMMLGYNDDNVQAFAQKAMAATLNDNLSADELVDLVMETGKFSVDTMALLDKANTQKYGNPEITEVNIGVSNKPGILISGHDLKDIETLLAQTEGTGVDVYTHGEMLPAHYYPAFKKYSHFIGNYGNAWWEQTKEFEAFNGPILMTTNCIVPPKNSYKNRVFTTGSVGFEGVMHIDANENGEKDFSAIIEMAKTCSAPTELETGKIVGGFAHHQVISLADKVVDAVKTGAIKKFFVMAGCDGRHTSRNYYTEFASALPNDTVILTAGCAKFRYNKLNLGDIGGIPRVLDAGQCNDSYSLAVIALKLKEVFELNDINELPIAYNIAWYEQKAVTVLLALLFLGVKKIHLGPTLPAFLSPNVAKVLVDTFGIAGIGEVQPDIEMFMAN